MINLDVQLEDNVVVDDTFNQIDVRRLINSTYENYIKRFLNESDISFFENIFEDVYVLVPVGFNTYVCIWTNNIYSLKKYQELSFSSKIPYLDIKPHTTIQYSGYDEIYMEVAFHQNVSYSTGDYTNPSKMARFKRIKYTQQTQEYSVLDLESNYTILFDLSEYDGINAELYKEYNNKGIDIYNPNDTAFKSCFISKNFNYDLTQKFRKNNLFQNKTLIGFYDSQCNYGGYNEETGYAKMICKSLNITGHEFENFNLTDKNKEDNLVMECTKDAKNLQENIIVLIYLIVFIIFVTFDILSFILCMKKLPNNNALKNDGLEIEPLSMKSTEGIDSNEIKINENGLWKIFIKNFKMIHPLFGIFSPSIIQPQLFKVSILFFNLFMLFGLNAFYFNIFGESLIEKRIFNKHRNNIIYPLKYELLKI